MVITAALIIITLLTNLGKFINTITGGLIQTSLPETIRFNTVDGKD